MMSVQVEPNTFCLNRGQFGVLNAGQHVHTSPGNSP